MSQQNTPDNDPNPSPYGQGPAGQEPSSNPYYGNAQAQDAPDLDAGAPQLRSAEEQRLNRKALLFLGGILVLLVAMGFLLFRGSQGDSDEPVKQREVARTSTPELPNLTAAQQAATPPPAETMPPIPMLPDPPRQNQELVPIASRGEQVQPRGPTLLERRISGSDDAAVGAGNRPGMPGQRSAIDEQTRQALLANMMPNQQAPQKERRGPDVEDVSSATYIQSPDALLVRGTYLRCVLETRIITDLSGYTSCLLTEPVYSINGRSLLLPKGSKIYGAYAGGAKGKRVEVIWDRVTTPNGIDVAMSSPGVDQLGGAGHPGQYSAHWGSRIASALMVSLIADAFKYAAAEHGPETTTVGSNGFAVQSPYESATARTMERLANDALNSSNRPPTVTINQGTIVNVYVAKDVDFTNVLNPHR